MVSKSWVFPNPTPTVFWGRRIADVDLVEVFEGVFR